MPEREPTAVVQLKVRMREPLRARIDDAAQRRGVSMNAEIVERLERSFLIQDPTVESIARMMAIAFLRGGQRGAKAVQHPRWAPEKWIDDPKCFRAAGTAVIEALKLVQPGTGRSDHDEALIFLFADIVARGGDVQFGSKDDGEES